MSKFNEFFDKHGTKIIAGLLVLLYFKTCSTNRATDKLDNKVEVVDSKIDTLENIINYKIIDSKEMIRLIKETPAWRTLEIEELSDKHRVPINAYKNKEEN